MLEVQLRKCSRCNCGLLGTSIICEFCGAVLSHVAAIGDDVAGVVCARCGGQSGPGARECTSCGQLLTQVCPRCGKSVQLNATSCPTCKLERERFYDECVRKELARGESEVRKRRRARIADDLVAVAFVATFLSVGTWQRFHRDAVAWKVWLLFTLLYLLMWALAKTGR